MIEYRPLADIGITRTDWLTAKHHFALGPYGNPSHLPVGSLYVWNDDTFAPRSGFPPHGHNSVEIITYVREGVVTHEDNLGNRGHIRAGDVQVMSAGSGIFHSERNDESTTTRVFQLWIAPRRPGGEPRWATKSFPRQDGAGRLVALASGRHLEDALPIRADADVYGANLASGSSIEIPLAVDDSAYLVPAKGVLAVNGVRVAELEGIALRDEHTLRIDAVTDAELILVVAGPMQ